MSDDELHEPRPADKRRAIVSVAFPSDDFAVVSKAARAANMKLSEFIRNAALERSTYLSRNPVLRFHASVSGSRRGPETIAPRTRAEVWGPQPAPSPAEQ